MDTKNVFLNGDLQEEIYMHPPPSYSHSPNQMCKLQRAFYGLKQTLRAWLVKFSFTISAFGFVSTPHDYALFTRCSDQGMILLLLYVDDMIITGDDIKGIIELWQYLNQHFEIKDFGSLSYFLGLEVSSDDDGYYLSQAKYAFDLLSGANISDSKIVLTPLKPNVKLSSLDGTPLSNPTLH